MAGILMESTMIFWCVRKHNEDFWFLFLVVHRRLCCVQVISIQKMRKKTKTKPNDGKILIGPQTRKKKEIFNPEFYWSLRHSYLFTYHFSLRFSHFRNKYRKKMVLCVGVVLYETDNILVRMKRCMHSNTTRHVSF